jgi:RsmE family RNA methyltransferase
VNLILLEAADLVDSATARLFDSRALHIRAVLKAKPGDALRIGKADGPRGSAEVLAVTAGEITLHCRWEESIPPRPPVDLLLAVPRPKVLKRLWAQLAALGVGRIALVTAARVERCYFDSHVLEPAFFRPLLIEGLQQACDTRVPEVSVHRAFRPFVEDELDGMFGAGVRLVADPGAEGRLDPPSRGFRLRETASAGQVGVAGGWTDGRRPGRVLLAVGPEGGWVPFELELLRARGFAPVTLGPRVLRTDTACVALLALIHARLPGSTPPATVLVPPS